MIAKEPKEVRLVLSIDTSVAALEETGWRPFTGVEQAISLLGAKLEGIKGKRVPFIFNDESTRSCICLRLNIYMSHVLLLCVSVIFFNA
jgi:hypothetical protein